MDITLAEIKTYLGISYNDEDAFIQLCIDSSMDYLTSGVTDFNIKITNDRFVKKAKLFAYLLIQTMYDNRSFTTKDNEKVRYIVRSMYLQMEYFPIEAVEG